MSQDPKSEHETDFATAEKEHVGMPPRFSIGVNVALQVILTLMLFAGINYLGYHYYKRWDLTPAASNSLSQATLTYLKKVGKETTISLIFPRNADHFESIRSLLEEYQWNGRKRVKLDWVDPLRDVSKIEQLKLEAGLSLDQSGILIRSNNRQRYLLEEELLVRDTALKDVPVIGLRVEDAVTSALMGLHEGGARRLYVVIGKGASGGASMGGAGRTLEEIAAQQNFELLPISLSSVSRIPEDAAGLLFIGLRYDLSEREEQMVKAYWGSERAGILVLLDPATQTPRLHRFLAGNGVQPRDDRVLMARSTATGVAKEFAVEAGFAVNSAVTRHLAGTITVLAGQSQSLELTKDASDLLRSQNLRIEPLIRAAERFWGERNYLEPLPVADETDGDTLPPVEIAAAVERGAVSDERLRIESCRMVVVGNSELLNPKTMLAESRDFVSASVNWMINRERLIGRSAIPKNAYRVQLNPRQSQLLFSLSVFALPGLALLLGWVVWLSRRAA